MGQCCSKDSHNGYDEIPDHDDYWKTVSMRESVSFHGNLSKSEAKAKLREHGGNCFLTRYDEDSRIYLLSVMNVSKKSKFVEFKINLKKISYLHQFQIDGRQPVFHSIVFLLEFYHKTPISQEIQCIGEELQRPDIIQDTKDDRVSTTQGSKGAVPYLQIQGFSRDPSYHGAMKGKDAERKLRELGGDHYLTRYSEKREMYVLTVLRKGNLVNFDFRIKTFQDKIYVQYEIIGSEIKFGDLRKLLNFYQKTPVSHEIDGIGDYLESDNYMPNYDCDLDAGYPETKNMDMFLCPHFPYEDDHTIYQDEIPVRVSVPTLSEISLLKWRDHARDIQKLAIIKLVASKWRDIGILLGLTMSELDTIRQDTLNDNHQSCQYVFSKWFENNGCRSYPITWGGVEELLVDIEMNTIAKRLKEALESLSTGRHALIDSD